MRILQTGVREETLNFLKDNSELQSAVFEPVNEGDFSLLKEEYLTADAFLIGENAINPLKLAQEAYSQDSFVSILIINDPLNFRKIKQALLFTPFVGPTVHCISNAAGKGMAEVVKDHVQRTRQRRSYQKFKDNLSNISAPPTQKLERVKSDYLNKVLEEAPIGFALINKNGNILSFNRYAAGLFGKSEREVLGQLLAELFPQTLKEELTNFFQDTTIFSLQKTIEYESGKNQRFLEITLSRVEKNDPSYKVALIKDITDQVMVQRSVEENSRRVRLIVESMPEMAWTARPSGEIDYLNKRWFEFTGQDPANAGVNWEKALHPVDLPRVLTLWEEALQDGDTYQLECRYLRASDQSYRWHITRALPVRNEEGEILQWVGTCTDIQGLKNIEKELQKTAEELAASNEELTAANEEITASNEELYETNEQLVQVNADLDNFIYTASHDLKAPISNIEGLVQVLRGKLGNTDRDDPQVKKILEMINTSIDRFQRTISDLTEVVKLQRLSELEPAQIDVRELVRDVELDLHQQIQEAGAKLEVSFKGSPEISFSYKNFKSIVYNLLSNALKYRSKERTLKIQVFFENEEQHYVFSVQDNGLGMKLKDEGKIFGMFQRMHSHVEGTGIGLYIVKKIVENAGGRITVESILGEGSKFSIYIPVKKKKNALS